jgi:hypothetical protein
MTYLNFLLFLGILGLVIGFHGFRDLLGIGNMSLPLFHEVVGEPRLKNIEAAIQLLISPPLKCDQ